MLKEIVAKGHYSFHEGFDSWQEAIKASYQPLLNDGTVEPVYIEQVIACVEKYGPYIVLVPGIAMPHSTEGAEGCKGTAVGFMRVENEVDFDPEDEEKKAQIFFSLASLDHNQHMEIIQSLMDVLMNEECVEELKNAKTKEDLEKIANKYE